MDRAIPQDSSYFAKIAMRDCGRFVRGPGAQ